MGRRRGRHAARSLSVRVWLGKLVLPAFLILSLGLIVFSRLDAPWARDVRASVTAFVAPVIDAFSAPIGTVRDWLESFNSGDSLRRENKALQEEIKRLRLQKAAIERIRLENARLRTVLKIPNDPKYRLLTARVIADPGGAYAHALIVNAGVDHGVRRGQAVVNARGLVGRVVEVGRRTARVILITDLNSRIPVAIQETADRAILSGAGTGTPRLTFLPESSALKVGMTVVTSGHGGVLPFGLKVGRVTHVDKNRITVKPFVVWSQVHYVRIMVFDAAGLVVPDIPEQGAALEPSRRKRKRSR